MKKYTIKPLVWDYVNGSAFRWYTADSVEPLRISQHIETGIITYGYSCTIEGRMKAQSIEEAKASCQAQHECRVQQFLDEVTE